MVTDGDIVEVTLPLEVTLLLEVTGTTTLFVLEVVLVDSVKIPLDSDNHLLQAAVTAAAAAATALELFEPPAASLELTEELLLRRLCL